MKSSAFGAAIEPQICLRNTRLSRRKKGGRLAIHFKEGAGADFRAESCDQPLTNREPTSHASWESGWPRRIQGRRAPRRLRHYHRGLVVGRIPPHGGCGRKSPAHQNRHQGIAI